MKALVDLVVAEANDIDERSAEPGLSKEEEAALKRREEIVQQRMASYFHIFGDKWARGLWQEYVAQNQLSNLLDDGPEYQKHLTRFLRSDPAYATISWINDVINERDYAEASRTLKQYALTQESLLWNKKIELSISKLAELAVSNKTENGGGQNPATQFKQIDTQLALIHLQDRLYSHIRPIIREAIDETAEIELVMKELGTRFVHGKPALTQLLKTGLTKLVQRQVLSVTELIDVFTLMDQTSTGGADDLNGQQYLLALQALKLSGLLRDEVTLGSLLEKLIWRRCMIRDDWEQLNRTELKNDSKVEIDTSATALFKTFKEGYKIGSLHLTFPSPLPNHPISVLTSTTPHQGFWDGPGAMQPLSPDDVLTTGCNPDSLLPLYASSPEYLEPVSRDLRAEDELLQAQIVKGRLDKWFPGVMAGAKDGLRKEAEAGTAAAQKRREMDAMITGGFKERDRELADGQEVVEFDERGFLEGGLGADW